ncbi:MAG TPA: MmcQ/YjbR family DNA-binding protein, partial [Planctomycetota bacterium]|nr:MmcQ/YjbR family DNA-binding protein [Planctomycetota bacterium]
MTWDEVRKVALKWPGMSDSRSYGTASLKVKGKFVA